MKTLLFFIILTLSVHFAFSQGVTLPYYTGFDSAAEKAGWQEFRTGFLSTYNWNNNGMISHDYNVGGNPNDTVIDWYVSPPLNFTFAGTISMKVRTGGFSPPTVDNCEIWVGTNNPDPASGNFTLLANLSYMLPQNQWIDTVVSVSAVSDSVYIAYKYKTIGPAWATYDIDSIHFTVPPSGAIEIGNSGKSEIRFYPNPVSSSATIKFKTDLQNCELNIFTVDGKLVKSLREISGGEVKIENENFSQGIYFYVLRQNRIVISAGKFIIPD